MKISNLKSGGFTLVETLVAIAILMIAIAGPLVLASRGLTSAVYARDQMVASFLAQETMEALKNRRDNAVSVNGTGSGYWVLGFSNCLKTSPCDYNPLLDAFKSCPALNDGCDLYLSDSGYSHVNNGTATIYRRYFYLTTKGTSITNSDREDILTVSVKWTSGVVPYDITIQSEFVDAIR